MRWEDPAKRMCCFCVLEWEVGCASKSGGKERALIEVKHSGWVP